MVDFEAWRVGFVRGINNTVVPAIDKLQRKIQGIQKRVDAQSKYVGKNRHVYDADGNDITLRAECLKNQDKYDLQWDREDTSNNYPTEYNEVSNSSRKITITKQERNVY